ncbi:glycoside hydrolase family 88 protein [Microvirga puerhi]|uniref:Glycoside hydrolase family 88 protein n=1 Tax=Microvirga puerhi TaxID=2876078 RepID=A0ABS7VW07_9HYPH|nr:glycoside hydrolase family 88 protein [Microvirga puerhi]MBZ6079043.1 glycoside hydrolase family 88 protein [Microvirga puerhi]
MRAQLDSYFGVLTEAGATRSTDRYQRALERCLERLRDVMPIVGLRNPKIGRPDLTWNYCGPFDWVVSFQSGQLWLALQLTGEPIFLNAARARRPIFRQILQNRHARDHDLGFQFSLSCVADWLMTSSPEARELGLRAAEALLARFHEEGQYLQAWNPRTTHGGSRAEFVAGRVIADTMQNLALLYWAHQETGHADFRDAALAHAATTARHLVRSDGTSYHTFVFDTVSGAPLRGETHQGFADESCWSRGQAWMIHGFAQCALTTGDKEALDIARRLAAKAEALMGQDPVPVWDYCITEDTPAYRDSSAGAIMAAGVYIIASLTTGAEAARWNAFGDRLLDGLLTTCDLTTNPAAHGLLDHGAAHVKAGFTDTMLPYGDYYFMEALMRSLGHTQFFW